MKRPAALYLTWLLALGADPMAPTAIASAARAAEATRPEAPTRSEASAAPNQKDALSNAAGYNAVDGELLPLSLSLPRRGVGKALLDDGGEPVSEEAAKPARRDPGRRWPPGTGPPSRRGPPPPAMPRGRGQRGARRPSRPPLAPPRGESEPS
jgi:hypothetical protein